MKKIFRIVMMIACVFWFADQTKAQGRTGVNSGFRPSRPVYNAGNYYYLPEIDTWYDIPNRHFIYFEYGRWVFSRELSNKYRDYDVNNSYKVLVDETRPYLRANRFRERYINYYTAYQNRFRNQDAMAGVRIYKDDRLNHRRQPTPDDRGRIQERSRVEDRPSIESPKADERATPRNYEPFEPRKEEERKRLENNEPIERGNTGKSNKTEIQEPVKPERNEEPEHIEEHRPIERGRIQSPERTDHAKTESSKTDIRAKEDARVKVEPVKKEPVAPAKVEEPVKADTVPKNYRYPVNSGGSREAQYSDKFKKPIGG
ncbi:MAG: hypothetical protein V4539_07925 [Bacteroidota bacterium]